MMSKLLFTLLFLAALVAFAAAHETETTATEDHAHHYEDDAEREIAEYHCEATHFELKLEDAACVVAGERRRSEDHTHAEETGEHEGDADGDDEHECETEISVDVSVDGSKAVYEIRRELENGEAEDESRLKVSWTGAGVYTCDADGACTAVTGACTSEVTSWTFTCPTSDPTTGVWDVNVSSVPAGIALTTSFTTTATSTQLPSQVEVLVSGDASQLGCTVGSGQKFCVKVSLETDCEREEDDSATDSEAVGCGAVNFAWATTDSLGTAITSYTSGNDVLYCVDTNIIVRWDPMLSSLGSTGSLLAATLALFALVF